jgi:hypothetical protein
MKATTKGNAMGSWQHTKSVAKVRAAQNLGMQVVLIGSGEWKVWVPVASFGLSAEWSR